MKGNNGQLPKLRPDVRLYLFYGSDEAGAADLARRLAATLPDAERVDIDAAALRKEPGRLADEAASLSLFGEVRLIRAAPLGEDSVEAVQLLLDSAQTGSPVIALAPSAKATSRLVKLALDSTRAIVTACYPPSAGDAEKLAAALLAEAGLRAAPGVARRIAEGAGGDRAVMAREAEKLALYLDAAPDRPRDATAADLDAIGADLGESELAAAVDALADGMPGELGAALTRLDEGGGSPIPWLRAMQRKLITLADMRTAVDRGEAADGVMKQARIFWSDTERTGRQLRRWTPAMIAQALHRVRDAELAAMAANTAGAVAAEHDMLAVARAVERR